MLSLIIVIVCVNTTVPFHTDVLRNLPTVKALRWLFVNEKGGFFTKVRNWSLALSLLCATAFLINLNSVKFRRLIVLLLKRHEFPNKATARDLTVSKSLHSIYLLGKSGWLMINSDNLYGTSIVRYPFTSFCSTLSLEKAKSSKSSSRVKSSHFAHRLKNNPSTSRLVSGKRNAFPLPQLSVTLANTLSMWSIVLRASLLRSSNRSLYATITSPMVQNSIGSNYVNSKVRHCYVSD